MTIKRSWDIWMRIALAVAVGIAVGGTSHALSEAGRDWFRSDFDQIFYGARALWHGENPYRVLIERGQLPVPLYYPLPALLAGMPLALLPLFAARAIFAGLGAAALAFVLMQRFGRIGLVWLLSGAELYALLTAQWSPLLTAGLALPWAAAFWVAKPSIGLALFVVRPRRTAVLAGLALVAVCVALWPWWVADWMTALRDSGHIVAPMTRPFGWLLLLAGLRWRRADARLLLVLAVVPQTSFLYEAVPLCFIAQTRKELVLLTVTSLVALLLTPIPSHAMYVGDQVAARWPAMLLCVYLPALLMVLRRPNVAVDPAQPQDLAAAA